MKYLLIIAIALVVWLAWKKRSLPSGKASTPAPPAPREPEQMVVCAHCGVHLPVSDSVIEQDRHFCSEAHRLAAKSTAGHD